MDFFFKFYFFSFWGFDMCAYLVSGNAHVPILGLSCAISQALCVQEKVKDTIKRLLQKLLVEFPVFHCGFASSLSSSYCFNQKTFAHVLEDVGMCYPKKRSIDFTFFCV
ncbi:uncharacterized protein LOC126619653 isoform X2 [Malus sylvestris]|uniref:uncharacterized protein LOC126619653 isoform X2 n=1 Tax=Malus sylvestris TaxID=3752 RepID=UPI0021AC25CD|nr:uncharacterized protein LOC126619653 isoform X2 [Malus sylvestris]